MLSSSSDDDGLVKDEMHMFHALAREVVLIGMQVFALGRGHGLPDPMAPWLGVDRTCDGNHIDNRLYYHMQLRSNSSASTSLCYASPPPDYSAKCYQDQASPPAEMVSGWGRAHVTDSCLVGLTKKRYPEAAAGPIYSAPTLAGLMKKFPAIRSFQGKVVRSTPDTWAFNDKWSLHFVVDSYHKVFHSLEAAEDAWENTRDERTSTKIFVTPKYRRSNRVCYPQTVQKLMLNDLKMSNCTWKDESILSVTYLHVKDAPAHMCKRVARRPINPVHIKVPEGSRQSAAQMQNVGKRALVGSHRGSHERRPARLWHYMGNVNQVQKWKEAVDVHGGEDIPGAPIYSVEDLDSGNADEQAVDLLVKCRGEALAFM
ncbi:hypothetical protein B0H14DRAFT_2655080 [Mycena olivaceomarginata]|nr:hypothetical protein B0H14DRAFT_2655080 [Mycena olivaceomarginata]